MPPASHKKGRDVSLAWAHWLSWPKKISERGHLSDEARIVALE
jgi:hypothetical protein